MPCGRSIASRFKKFHCLRQIKRFNCLRQFRKFNVLVGSWQLAKCSNDQSSRVQKSKALRAFHSFAVQKVQSPSAVQEVQCFIWQLAIGSWQKGSNDQSSRVQKFKALRAFHSFAVQKVQLPSAVQKVQSLRGSEGSMPD
ncbi:MAG: hypothetical protein HGA37_09100 [Lentimicrobium sp.]|nr:hypothetical protein [Lentimicrobium sp.]